MTEKQISDDLRHAAEISQLKQLVYAAATGKAAAEHRLAAVLKREKVLVDALTKACESECQLCCDTSRETDYQKIWNRNAELLNGIWVHWKQDRSATWACSAPSEWRAALAESKQEKPA